MLTNKHMSDVLPLSAPIKWITPMCNPLFFFDTNDCLERLGMLVCVLRRPQKKQLYILSLSLYLSIYIYIYTHTQTHSNKHFMVFSEWFHAIYI